MKVCKFLPLLLITIITFPCFSADKTVQTSLEKKQANKLFCWRATDEDSTVYLMGTIHVGMQDMYPLDPKIENAFKDSESLVLELDMVNIDPAIVQKKLMYALPESLQNHVSEKVYSELCKYFLKNYKIPEAQISQMKPSLILSTIIILKMQEYGYNPLWGVDMYLMNTRGKKKLIELETLDFQLNLFDKLADNLLEKELEKLNEEGKLKEMFQKMISSWKTGDAKAMEEIILEELLEDPEGQEVYQYMIVDRNKTMAKKISAMMEKPGTNFVAVGAGHMIGKDGIVAILAENKKLVQLTATPIAQSYIFAPPKEEKEIEVKVSKRVEKKVVEPKKTEAKTK